nr:retrovirus-related Pol polyprotein from transposon TNT 1-94 [Tanacetum cinerariifolium]
MRLTCAFLQIVLQHRYRSAEVHDYGNCDDNEIFNMFTQEDQYTELLKPIHEPHQVLQNDNNVISEVTSVEQSGETEAAKFVGDFKSLAKEADESLAKHKALELEIKRLLKAVVSQDIISIMQKESVVDTSDLQNELERTKERFENCIIKKKNEYAKLWNDWYKKCDECKYEKISYDKSYKDVQQKIERLQVQLGDLKCKSKDTLGVSDTLNPSSQKFENENVKLEFQNTIYENAKLRSQLFKKVSMQKDNTRGTSKNTKFAKQSILGKPPMLGDIHPLSKPVTSNSVPTPQEPKVVKNDKNSRGKKQMTIVSIKDKQKKRKPKVKKPKKVGFIERLATPKPSKPRSLLRWSPTGRMFDLNGKIIASSKSESQSDCSKGDNACTSNPVEPTIKRFPNATFSLAGFGDLQWGNILIARVYFVGGLGHNMFPVGQLCLPMFKYHKEHLCPSCDQGKSKRASHPSKPVPNSRQRLHLLHMDLCGPMRIASINGKQYVLMIVNDYSRYTWAIATSCFTQNRSIIHRRFNKTPYELINGRKPDISFLYVFEALCYPNNDREVIGKLGAKAMYDDYIGGQPSATARTVPVAQEHQDVDELNPNAMFDVNTFDNPFVNPSTSAAKSSSLQNDSGFELTGFLDANYARCKDTFKSTSGGAQFLGEKLIPIYCDSKSAIAISCNTVQYSRTKHITVRYHFIKEHVEKGTIELYFVKTDYQLADLFTKALPADRFNYLVRHLGMRSLSPQELDRLAKSQ